MEKTPEQLQSEKESAELARLSEERAAEKKAANDKKLELQHNRNAHRSGSSSRSAPGRTNEKREDGREDLERPALPDLSSVIRRKKKVVESPLSKKVDMAELMQREFNVQSNNVMSDIDVLALSSIFSEAGIPEDKQQAVAIEIANAAVDVGSSKHSEFLGKSAYCDLDLPTCVGLIKEVTTLRRFCMYYAKVIWNLRVKSRVPPANWARKGFKDETKFAAFDFFVGVFDESALNPEGGLVKSPTQRELMANLAHFEVSVFRQGVAEGNRSLNLGEISGGSSGNSAHNPFEAN
ncbi:coat protein [Panax ginseng flexivirus 1]|uniref:coat protein n=1 Tax=Panax ginseng flexivirus 1 TaxID=2303411 RepID=UPI000E3359A3|nr:coat protein [Panax ginseng flexivirus 1]AXN92356.1 coat protein [Panax ginseng flexivirus 1]